MNYLTREQLIEVLAKAKAARERDWVMYLVAYCHGLRASEAVALTPENFSDGLLDVQRRKGSNRTVQQMIHDAEELLDEPCAVAQWLARHKAMHAGDGLSRRLFPISRVQFFRLWQRYARAAGLPKRLQHPHCLKHSIAMHGIPQAGIQNVRQWLGHKSISSTGEYLKLSDEEAGRAMIAAVSRQAVQRTLWPKG